MMLNNYKPIKDYEKYYLINKEGKIYSLISHKIIKTRLNKKGYEIVNLKSKTFLVHRLVAQTFISNPNNYKEINHKDENKLNNNADNLEWCDRKYNCNYGSLPKKVSERFSKKIVLIDNYGKPIIYFESSIQIEKIMGIDHSSVIKCCKGKQKTAGGYMWKYER